MEVQVSQVNQTVITDVISIRSNEVNSAIIVFKDMTAFKKAKERLTAAKMKFMALHVTPMMYLPQGTALLVTV